MPTRSFFLDRNLLTEALRARQNAFVIHLWHSSPLNYFQVTAGDGLRLSWAQHVNTKEDLEYALASPVCILEGDVNLFKESQSTIPVMTSLRDFGEIRLDQWLSEVTRENEKGVMLHFHSTYVLEPAIDILKHVKIMGPVILRADILQAHEGSTEPVDPSHFFNVCGDYPDVFLCVGWTANIKKMVSKRMGYSRDCLNEMLQLLLQQPQTLTVPIMLSVHAMVLKKCIPRVQDLIHRVPNSTLYVWTDEENPISCMSDLMDIRSAFPLHQVFYSFPEEQFNMLRTLDS